MKIYKKLLVLFFLALTIISCEKNVDSDGISKITYYPDFVVNGDETILLPTGTAYTEPGVTASANGEDIAVTSTVAGLIRPFSGSTVDAELENQYEITYSATNSDGFSGIVTRTVWVATTGDLVNSIEGLYISTVKRTTSSGFSYFRNMEYILIYKTGVNTYAISDGIGGWYDIGRAYGPTYRATPIEVTAVDIPSNSFTYSGDFGVGAFGGSATMSGFTVDPVAKTITFTTVWDGGPYTFDVTLTQVTI